MTTRLDIINLFRTYQIPHLTSGHRHCKAGWVQTHCPWCAAGVSGWHLGYSIVKHKFNCWRCGFVKTIPTLAMILHMQEEQVVKILWKFATSQETTVEEVHRPNRVIPPPGVRQLMPQHRDYLKKRGFDPDELVSIWRIAATGALSGDWSWRIIIPIEDETGRIVAYQGRAIGGARPRYLTTSSRNSPIELRRVVYGLRQVPSNTIVVVEGVTDVWRIGPGAVATLGIDWKQPQLNLLRRFPRRYIMFDPEEKAQRRAEALANALAIFEGSTCIISGLRSDPGDMSTEDVLKLRQEILL